MDSFGDKFPYIPERIFRLGELACNLWWSWHPESRALFYKLAGNGTEFKAQNQLGCSPNWTDPCWMPQPKTHDF